MRQGLAEWQPFLADKAFPVLQSSKQQVQQLIDQPQLSIMQYTGPVFFDACFAAHIFHQVNTARVQAGRGALTTLDNALSHLGQGGFQSLLNQTCVFESLQLPESHQQAYLRVLGQSCHAALQAKDWAQQRNVVQLEEVQLAALLQRVPELLLWCYGEQVMPQIEQCCYIDKLSCDDAAKKIMGCSLRELSAALALQWNLPEMVELACISKQEDFTLASGVSLAGELARQIEQNWYGRDMDELIEKIARYKGKSAGEIEHRLHLNAVQMSEDLTCRGFRSPAQGLPLLADDNYINEQFRLQSETVAQTATARKVQSPVDAVQEKRPAATTVQKSVAKNSQAASAGLNLDAIRKRAESIRQSAKKSSAVVTDNTAEVNGKTQVKKTAAVSDDLASAVKQLKQMVAQAKPTHELIAFAVQCILLCGVERCVFSVRLPNKELLVARYAAQVSPDIEIRGFKISLDKPHVFKLLMEKSRSIFLNDTNRNKYWNLLPGALKMTLGVQSFFAMSIFTGKHALGLMYADKVKGELTAAEFKQFQAVCQLLEKGIVQSAHNRKKASADK